MIFQTVQMEKQSLLLLRPDKVLKCIIRNATSVEINVIHGHTVLHEMSFAENVKRRGIMLMFVEVKPNYLLPQILYWHLLLVLQPQLQEGCLNLKLKLLLENIV